MAKLYTGIYSPWLHSYDDVRSLLASFHQMEALTGQPFTDADMEELQRSARVVYRRPACDPLRVPLSEGWRHVLDSDGIDASGRDYRILPEDPDHPWTDAELTEYMEESEVYYGRGHHDYDCSGERFTSSWDARRTPAGIVLVHCWETDT